MGLGPVPGFVSSPFPPPRPALPALCVAGHPVRVSLTLARRYAVPCGLGVPRARSGCPSGIPCVPFVCVCARSLAVSAPFPPPRVGVGRAPCVVPVQGTDGAIPCGPRPSAFPASVLCTVRLVFFWGGGGPVPFPPCLAWGRVPPCGRACASGAAGRRGGRGGRRAPRVGGSLYLVPSLCLSWAGTKAGVIGVARVMEGAASIPLRFVFACLPRVWFAGRPCVLARVCLPVVATVGAGGWRRGGVWRTDLAAPPPPGAAALFGGGADLPWPGGGRELAPPGPSPASRGPEGGEWGGRGGRRDSALLRFPGPEPWRLRVGGLYPLALASPHGRRCGAAHSSLPRARPGLFGTPGRRARSGRPLVG